MNQGLESRLAAELQEACRKGVAGKAITSYLLDQKGKSIKIPNIMYNVLQMLEDEREDSGVMYTEYCGKCPIEDKNECAKCRAVSEKNGDYSWCFWYTKHENALNIAAKPVYSLDLKDGEDYGITDTGKNDIYFKMYVKYAYQCMAVYDTGKECYLPVSFLRMVEYMLFFFSYKAFFAAMKSSVTRNDAEMNYVIREILETTLGLKDVQRKDLYKNISRMQGLEKAALTRIITKWGSGGGLQQGLYDVIHEFERNLQRLEICNWVEGNQAELRRVLGDGLFNQLQEHCGKNKKI